MPKIYHFCWAIALVACAGAKISDPRPATVFFQLDAPLCSSIIPAQFGIDDVLVGQDTFRVHLANEHTRSRGFTTSPGQHKISGRFFGPQSPWLDTTVTLREGESFTHTLPMYCS